MWSCVGRLVHPVDTTRPTNEACHLQEITQNKKDSIKVGFYLCTNSWSPHNRPLVPQARSWSPHIWRRPLKMQNNTVRYYAWITSSVDHLRYDSVLFHKMMRCAKYLKRPWRGEKVAAGCHPSVLLRYPLWIQDKGNYFCPAVHDYWPSGGETYRETDRIGSERARNESGISLRHSLLPPMNHLMKVRAWFCGLIRILRFSAIRKYIPTTKYSVGARDFRIKPANGRKCPVYATRTFD